MDIKDDLLIRWINRKVFSKAEDQFMQEIARLTKIDIERFRQRVRDSKKQEFDKIAFVKEAENAYNGFHVNYLLDCYFGIFASIELEKPDEVILFTKEGLKYAGYVRFCNHAPLLLDVHAGPSEYSGLPKKAFLKENSEEIMVVQKEGSLEKRLVIFNEFDDLEKIRGKKVLILDDAIETGGTLSAAYQIIQRYGPKKLRIAFDDLSGNSYLLKDMFPVKSVKYCSYDIYIGFQASNMPISHFKELLEKAQEHFVKKIN